MSERVEGTVKWFNAVKGYVFMGKSQNILKLAAGMNGKRGVEVATLIKAFSL